ncbi:thioredoxin [Rehaibacterium terrae]|uniref:Thioredoxin n=1 Tax=Rehaibacterium terrae TaxID=1341696 RepID=A0A7W7Y0A2_9GAMM|nr:thioredoxin [Rehaibacterium terrae]MBB5015731.1 putative thioredoxin [Rehaibacterium terrae]
MTDSAFAFDATTAGFQTEVLERSLQTPVLVEFWAAWCGPCKQLKPVLEKLAAEYNGAFVLAKVDVDAEQALAGYFQIRSVPTVMLIKDGQLVDGFPGALPEGQLREFLKHHGIVPAGTAEPESPAAQAPRDPQAEIAALREALAAEPDKAELRLDLALALLRAGETDEAAALLDALPANLATDDRARAARARLGFAQRLKDAPTQAELQRRIEADPDDLEARYLLGTHLIVDGDARAGLDHFLHMLRTDRDYADGLPRKALIEAFAVIEDEDLVGAYRRKMASVLF